MIGLLSIEKQSFDRYNKPSNIFAKGIMFYVRENFDKLVKSVNSNEWTLFKSGLAVLVCIELLNYRTNNFWANELAFFSANIQ